MGPGAQPAALLPGLSEEARAEPHEETWVIWVFSGTTTSIALCHLACFSPRFKFLFF